jgi:hypothetical protein
VRAFCRNEFTATADQSIMEIYEFPVDGSVECAFYIAYNCLIFNINSKKVKKVGKIFVFNVRYI